MKGKPVKLTKDGKTVEAVKPSTITTLKSQGWKPVAAEVSAPVPAKPSKRDDA
jgi:hypothetical protein